MFENEEKSENKRNDVFVSFLCNACNQEIEASADLAGQVVDCPACGEKITVPDADETPPALKEALKSRTIRIELDSL